MKRKTLTAALAAFGILVSFALTLGLGACGAAPAAQAAENVPAPAGTAASAAGTAASAVTPGAEDVHREITVSASGNVSLTPDKAAISFGVNTQEKTAEAAQQKNSEAVDRVIALLKEKGVEEKSIRTVNYSMYPQYDYNDGKQKLTGYEVRTSLSIQDQDITEVGKLISGCVAAGINSIDSISFLCSGYDEAYSEALGKAVSAAREKAEALASASGMTLGSAVTITEGWQDTSARYTRAANMDLAAEEAASAKGVSFMPGESEITANVTVTFEMN